MITEKQDFADMLFQAGVLASSFAPQFMRVGDRLTLPDVASVPRPYVVIGVLMLLEHCDADTLSDAAREASLQYMTRQRASTVHPDTEAEIAAALSMPDRLKLGETYRVTQIDTAGVRPVSLKDKKGCYVEVPHGIAMLKGALINGRPVTQVLRERQPKRNQ